MVKLRSRWQDAAATAFTQNPHSKENVGPARQRNQGSATYEKPTQQTAERSVHG
jgi:hypothetical protein